MVDHPTSGSAPRVSDADLRARLARLGQVPVDGDVAAAHLDRMAAPGPSPVGRGRTGVLVPVAAVAALVVAGSALAAGVDRGVPRVDIAAPGGSGPDLPAAIAPDDDPCVGPPPFARQRRAGDTEGERAANREAEAEAFEHFRETNCPEEEEEDIPEQPSVAPSASMSPSPAPVTPAPTAPSCTGPPPFAGQPPEGDTEEERAANREAEVQAFEQFRAENCPEDEAEEAPTADDAGPPDNAGPPDTAGPPDNAGPPKDTGPPDDAGPPENAGPPDDAGPPDNPGPPEDAGPPADGAG